MGLTHKTITICGSTRFKKEIQEAYERLTLEGNVVFAVGVFENKKKLTRDELNTLELVHMEKITKSDEVFIINKNGYIGDDTAFEIAYAESQGISVNYLEDINSTRIGLNKSHECDCRACISESDEELQEGEDDLVNTILTSLFGLSGANPDFIVVSNQNGIAKIIDINNIKEEGKKSE